jgi:hypothetical protein
MCGSSRSSYTNAKSFLQITGFGHPRLFPSGPSLSVPPRRRRARGIFRVSQRTRGTHNAAIFRAHAAFRVSFQPACASALCAPPPRGSGRVSAVLGAPTARASPTARPSPRGPHQEALTKRPSPRARHLAPAIPRSVSDFASSLRNACTTCCATDDECVRRAF